MNRLSLADLKVKAGLAFVRNLEAIKGGSLDEEVEEDSDGVERKPRPIPKPPVNVPCPCDNV